MDTRTGEIVPMKFVEELKKKNLLEARFYKEIPADLLPELEGMNRKQRRIWYSQNKHRFNDPPRTP